MKKVTQKEMKKTLIRMINEMNLLEVGINYNIPKHYYLIDNKIEKKSITLTIELKKGK